MRIVKIISGGQTGADLAGLIVAAELGIPTGGSIPKGFLTEEGPRPALAGYGLIETTSDKYPPRTFNNVNNAGRTIIFEDVFSPGCTLTKRLCKEAGKPWLLIDTKRPLKECAEFIKLFLSQAGDADQIINIAGNRETKSPGIQARVIAILKEALKEDPKPQTKQGEGSLDFFQMN